MVHIGNLCDGPVVLAARCTYREVELYDTTEPSHKLLLAASREVEDM